MSTTTGAPRRSGEDTRAAIQRVALDLFTTRGYEATSMREIAEVLGIRKASLYYHFAGKEDIVRSLFDRRGREAEELLDWVRQQPQAEELVRAAALRWVESFSEEKLQGIRFLTANPLLAQSFDRVGDGRIGSALSQLAQALSELLPDRSRAAGLQLRMALLSINAAVAASSNGQFTDAEILAAARASAIRALDGLLPQDRP